MQQSREMNYVLVRNFVILKRKLIKSEFSKINLHFSFIILIIEDSSDSLGSQGLRIDVCIAERVKSVEVDKIMQN